MQQLMIGIAMGLGGTVAMDLWALCLHFVLGYPRPAWRNPGRWVAHVARGKVFHDDINAAEPVPGESAIGWAFHYVVGAIYGVLFVLLAGKGWLEAPTWAPLWAFALVTIAAGWFLLHPGMGLGWALSKTPTPWKGRALGLIAHTVFGLGMYAVALIAT
ncbi:MULTISPECIES: DUF2938 domain-containing protein [Roseobacteraceae]|uniref:DUF2938 domain-containing protein n=1 Tax=Roseobacteraceae TaxID=2854170 RepID=UPI0013BA2AA0|nr:MULTISPECIES: DUF2938 domain-containing protein [Roseobacteraceae]MCA0995886.1 DUF2938 domain-containing protein [Alloyangia pacifica]NDV98597.1 DUF2938 domain-containing protein [Salipiger sp. PrR002]NDW57433.1 DUF2938 domain-containing protein [Salipiger sp. PrR004]